MFIVCAPCAYADDIPVLNVNITYVTATMGPSDGSGDNISFTLIGPGTIIKGYGGMACFDWCSGALQPSDSGFASKVYIGAFTQATIRGTNYDPDSELYLACCLFSDLASVSGFVGSGDTFKTLNLNLPCCASWASTSTISHRR